MKAQVVTAREIKAFDRIILDRRHYIVLSKNFIPVRSGSEIGFCINCKERSWKAFHWNEQITRIN